MKNGYKVTCPRCGAVIDDFSCADEWDCDCGYDGILTYDDDDDEIEDDA